MHSLAFHCTTPRRGCVEYNICKLDYHVITFSSAEIVTIKRDDVTHS